MLRPFSRAMFTVFMTLALIMALVYAPTRVTAQTQTQPQVTDAIITAFEKLIQEEMDYFHVPGMAAVIIQNGKVLYAKGFGLRSVETGEAFTTQTQFRIGSTTKSMTSLLIAQLVDEGKLNWDDPVTKYYPDFRTSSEELTPKIRVRDLMGMDTGLKPEGMYSFQWGEWDVADLFEAVAALPVTGEFDVDFAYNNDVYALAGYIATIAAGMEPTLENYKALIQSRLFDPVGMSSAIITDDLKQLSDDYASSYEFWLTGGLETPHPILNAPIGVIAPAGAVWVNIEDMAKYVITQMQGGVTPEGARIVSEKNLSETWQKQVSTEAGLPMILDAGYGMGWALESYNRITIREHGGGWDGYRTAMTIFPEANAAVILFANHIFGDVSNYVLGYTFAELLFELEPMAVKEGHKLFEASTSSLKTMAPMFSGTGTVAPDKAAPLVGAYEEGWSVEHRDDQTLWLVRPGWAFMLYPLPTGYVIANGAVLGVPVMPTITETEVKLTFTIGSDRLVLMKK